MQRTVVEPLVIATAATIMAGAVLLAGVAIERSTQAAAPSGLMVRSGTGDTERCVESLVTAPPDTVGRGVLCENGRDLSVVVQVHGLTPREEYTALLSYTHQPAVCGSSACWAADYPAEGPPELTELIGGGIVSPLRTLDLRGDLHSVHLRSGTLVVLTLLHHREENGRHAQFAFTVPVP